MWRNIVENGKYYKIIKSLKKEVKEIRRNLPSATPSPLPVPTGINLQTLDRGNAFRTGSLTLNSLTTVPLLKPKLTKRLSNPSINFSKRNKLRSFLNQL